QRARYPGDEAECTRVLGALDLELVAPDVALAERVLAVTARVADGVHVVADAHDGDGHTVDVDPACGARLDLVEPADGCGGHRGSSPLLVVPMSSLAATRERSSSARSPAGSWASTSSKNPSTTSRSATPGSIPRLSR